MHNLANICTCSSHKESRLNVNAYDPTRTLTLRSRFAREMARRFAELRQVIRQAIIDEDVFGLVPGTRKINSLKLTPPGRGAFAFPRGSDKIKAFMEWLEAQEKAGILQERSGQLLRGVADAGWTDKYILEGYQRGVTRARQELARAGYKVPSLAETGGIGIVLQQPFHAERVSLLYNRTFTDLRGISNAMSGQISRVLSQGMAEGQGPRVIASRLMHTITGQYDLAVTDTLGRYIPAERRAKMLARTETIRAHADATLTEFKSWGVEGVSVKAEFRNAGDDRVCSICDSLEGKEYTMEEAEGVIPVHPMCRCVFLPAESTS